MPGTPAGAKQPTGAKERIETCATDLFGRKGFAATSVREIVEAAGVTKPTLYYYFRDKDDLYARLVRGILDEFYAGMGDTLAGAEDLETGLRRVVELYFERARSQPMIVRFMFRAIFDYGPGIPRVDFARYAERNDALLRGLLERAAAAGQIAPESVSEFATIEFTGLIYIYMMRNAMGFADELSPRLAQRIAGLFLRGITTRI